jgi:hypothetical protein
MKECSLQRKTTEKLYLKTTHRYAYHRGLHRNGGVKRSKKSVDARTALTLLQSSFSVNLNVTLHTVSTRSTNMILHYEDMDKSKFAKHLSYKQNEINCRTDNIVKEHTQRHQEECFRRIF